MSQIDFRKLIKDELKRRKKSGKWLGRQKSVTCHWTTVLAYLRGDHEIAAGNLEEILSLLEIQVGEAVATGTTKQA